MKGKTLLEHYPTWAKYFALYLKGMEDYGLKVDFISIQMNLRLNNDGNHVYGPRKKKPYLFVIT